MSFKFVYPIKKQHICLGKVKFYDWCKSMIMTEKHKELFLKDIGIIDNNNYIRLDNNINLYMSIDEKDKKAKGMLVVNAEYEHIEDIERQFKQFNIQDIKLNAMIYIIKQPDYSVTLNIINENLCQITFVTPIPHNYESKLQTNQNYMCKVEYYIKENKEQIKVIKKSIRLEVIKIFIYLIIINIFLVSILFVINEKN